MRTLILATAVAAGTAVRAVRVAGLSVLGAGLVALGLGLAWPPLGVVALGVAALAADWGRQR